jgi:hypothetical protein
MTLFELTDRNNLEFPGFRDSPQNDHERLAANVIKRGLRDAKCFDLHSIAEFTAQYLKGIKADAIEFLSGSVVRLPFNCCWFEIPTGFPHTKVAIVAFGDGSGGRGNFMLMPAIGLVDSIVIDLEVCPQFFLVEQGVNGLFAAFKEIWVPQGDYKYMDNLPLSGPDASIFIREQCIKVLYALYFLGWKRESRLVTDKPSRQARRHAERTGKPHPPDICRIDISTFVREYTRRTAEGSKPGKAPHTRRGHFAAYSEKAPLFNCQLCQGDGHKPDGRKPHVGNFWHNPIFLNDRKVYLLDAAAATLGARVSRGHTCDSDRGLRDCAA